MQEDSIMKDKDVLCVVETPYQALMAYLIFQERDRFDPASVTLAISSLVPNAQELAALLLEQHVFDEIILASPRYSLPVRFYGLFNILDNYLRPKHSQKQFAEMFPDLADRNFDVLACSGTTRFSLDAKIQCVKDGETVFFDDGSGSHTGLVFRAFSFFDEIIHEPKENGSFSQNLKLVAKRFFKKMYPAASYNTKEVWLFKATPEEKSMFTNIGIFDIPIAEKDTLSNLFGSAHYSIPKSIRAIYLSLPSSVHPSLLETEEKIIATLEEEYGSSLAIKLHPRCDTPPYVGESARLIPSDALWEGLILDGTIDESVTLIGCASTAQLTPKTIGNVEPKLVFTYELFDPRFISMQNGRSFMTKCLEAYRDKARIFNITSFDKIEPILCDALQRD